MTSLFSLLTGAVLIALVYGLSFLPTATLPRPDDEAGFEVVEEGAAPKDTDKGSAPNA